MRWHWSEKSVVGSAIAVCAVLFSFGWLTRDIPDDKPYLHISGGGFIFNYRNADAYYGFTADVLRPLGNGSIIEAIFEDTAGGRPHTAVERVSSMTTRYSLRSPPLHGIAAHNPYTVSIRVYDRLHRRLIWETERSYSSQLSDEVMPRKALTVGPGYHRPENFPASPTESEKP